MKLRRFCHGVHLSEDGKTLTADRAIRSFRPTGEAVYPLNQHIGAPASPIVAVGDTVAVGQLLAEPAGGISAAICSAVSGTVKAIEPRRGADGRDTMAVVVDNDGLFTPLSALGQQRDPDTLSAREILDIIRNAGIVGQGGAGFPTHVKLTVKTGAKPDTVIVNGAECEPYLTCDYRLMLEQADRLVEGLQVVLRLFPEARGIIAVEDNKPSAIQILQEKTAGLPRIAVLPLKTIYPQGGERMLIHAVTGRTMHAKMLPADVGCVVLNVSTVISVWKAVCRQTPQISTVITVTGDSVVAPCNLEVPVGSSYREVLEEAGGLRGEPEKIITGGPMTGVAMTSLDVPVQKTAAALLLLSHDEVAAWEPTACMRCGRCVRACPSLLMPVSLSQMADGRDFDAFAAGGGMECIECGCCSYVCPAKRRLTQSMKYGRREIKARQKAEGEK